MLETLNNCPVCEAETFKLDFICEDYAVSHEKFQILKCTNCDFRFTNPRPGQIDIGKYYQSAEYISHQDNNKGLINKLYYIVKNNNLNYKLQLINNLHPKSNLLDIGCGTGSFLEICQNNGWKVTGVEPDDDARKKAIDKTNSLIRGNIFELPQQTVDIITMWHVLEHIHNLNESIEKINSLLSSTGKLIVAVPNRNSYDARKFGEAWAAYDIPRHLYHFTQPTLIKLMKRHRLKIQQVLPMKYDAYYISLMSLKYKNKHPNYFKALLTGYLSNQWAKKNGSNYSSLTYIFAK